jgi:hypothetical protein
MDGDGLLDMEEAAYGTNALSPDTDRDRFTDGDEVLVMRTDPLDAQDPAPARRRAGRRRRWFKTTKAIPVPRPPRYLLLAAGLGCLTVLHRMRRQLTGASPASPPARRGGGSVGR